MHGREFLKEYLTCTRRDRIAILLLAGLILIIFFLPDLFRGNAGSRVIAADTAWFALLEKKEPQETQNRPGNEREYAYRKSYHPPTRTNRLQADLFYFDPNTATGEEWKKLGLRDKTITTILHYRAKGGQFRKPEDLQRIYGLFPDEFNRIQGYIRIATEPVHNLAPAPVDLFPKKKPARYAIIEINRADTSALIALPGIGSKLAARIISFRDKLGGFYSIDQVSETFGLPDSTFLKIRSWLQADPAAVRKININTATLEELKAHPYIRYNLAQPLIAYRNEHGPFGDPGSIRRLAVITEELWQKISPYLATE